EACAALFAIKELRDKMAKESVAAYALSAIPGASDAEKAAAIKATLDHAARTTELKAKAHALDTAMAELQVTAAEADQLLELRVEEWCGGPIVEADLDKVLQKCRSAAAAPEGLDKQITFLSTELEVRSLGLGDLIGGWTAQGISYAGVAWAVEAAFFRSAAEKMMRDNPVLARHAGQTHE